jgi:predicted nucleic acid-binding protein
VTRWRSAPIARDLAHVIRVACGPRLVRVDAGLVDEAIAIAGAAGLTVYDAAYVACARSRGWALVSTDLRDLVGPGYATRPEEALA